MGSSHPARTYFQRLSQWFLALAQQLRQVRDIGGDAPRLVTGEQVRRRSGDAGPPCWHLAEVPLPEIPRIPGCPAHAAGILGFATP